MTREELLGMETLENVEVVNQNGCVDNNGTDEKCEKIKYTRPTIISNQPKRTVNGICSQHGYSVIR